MDERLIPIRGIFRSNEALLTAALDGVAAPEHDVWLQRSGEANHVAFLAVHLVGARHYIVKFLGGSSQDPLERYHERARSIEQVEEFPPAPDVLTAWRDVAPVLDAALSSVTRGFLNGDSGLPFPAPGPSRLDALTFLAQHETYHIGQICLMRRIHDMPAAEWPALLRRR